MPTHTAPRPMAPDDPRHGTYAGWHAHHSTHTPACEPCLAARRRYQKRLDVDHTRGIRRRIPTTRARRHIEALRARGLSYKLIAETAGVSPRTVYRAAGLEGDGISITRGATLAILNVPLDTPVTFGYLPAIGAVRRLQALAVLGHTFADMADRIGIARSNMSLLINGARPGRPNQHVQAATWHAIAALYDDWCMTPGGSKRTKTIATSRGWAPPLAWDDIDDPTERPKVGRRTVFDSRPKTDVDEAIVLRVMAGDKSLAMTTAERREVVRRLRERGVSFLEVEALTGIRKVERYTLPDGEAVA